MSAEPPTEPRFDVAVSFAGEDREFVEDVVRGIGDDREVFYDQDFLVETWGRDLVEYFTDLYQNRARYVVMFVSSNYAEKSWTTLERRSALAGALARKDPYVLPVRLDDTQLPGLLPTTGYLDARRVGLQGIIDAIKAKLAGRLIALPARPPLLDGKVPRSDEAVQALIQERPPGWEYKLYAALLLVNINKSEHKYRDHYLGYADRTGVHVDASSLQAFVQNALGSVEAIVENFNAVLNHGAQDAAFGPPGKPGDVASIQHLAERFGSVYEDLMNWSHDLRGASVRGEHGQAAVRLLAHATDGPIEAVRQFVRDFVSEVDTIDERLERGEKVSIILTLTLNLDSSLMARFQREMKLAFKRD
jgi:TIR domain-containing protein